MNEICAPVLTGQAPNMVAKKNLLPKMVLWLSQQIHHSFLFVVGQGT